jgi:nicotinamidase-related amidase
MTSPNRALILIDVQQDYFGDGPLEIHYPPHTDSLPRIVSAIDAATEAGLPVVAVQHTMGDDAPLFNPTQPGFRLHPEVESRRTGGWKSVVKRYGTVFAGTDLLAWLRDHDIDTITLVGYMTNNCVLASAAEAETHGLAAEVLSDATGAINIANEAGFADAIRRRQDGAHHADGPVRLQLRRRRRHRDLVRRRRRRAAPAQTRPRRLGGDGRPARRTRMTMAPERD